LNKIDGTSLNLLDFAGRNISFTFKFGNFGLGMWVAYLIVTKSMIKPRSESDDTLLINAGNAPTCGIKFMNMIFLMLIV